MIDQPEPQILLEAMADALDGTVVNGTVVNGTVVNGTVVNGLDEAGAKYTVRVVVNLGRILAREAELGPEAKSLTEAALSSMFDHDGDLKTLATLLDRQLVERPEQLDRRLVFELLKGDVGRRLRIARPSYSNAHADGP